jgi:hypothetical protein
VNRHVVALALLDDGASYSEVARTLKCSRKWVSDRFPNRGWTSQQGGAYGYMLRKSSERMELK